MLNNIFLGTNEKYFLTIRKWGLLLSNVLLWFLLNRPGVMCVDLWPADSMFSQHKIGNIVIIANFVLTYICSFLLYFQHLMPVNVNFDVIGHKRTVFPG